MKKAFLILFLITIKSFQTYSQSPVRKFGDIDKKNLEMKFYEKDSTAEALEIFSVGDVIYRALSTTGEFEIVYSIHKRIKIFNEEGYEYANVKIPYYYQSKSNSESITSIKASSYNIVNGKIEKTKLTKSNIIKVKKEIEGWNYLNVNIPKVKKGTIIDYKYTIKSPFLSYINTWYFEKEIPILWTEYNVSIPEYFRFVPQTQTFHSFLINGQQSSSSATGTISTVRRDYYLREKKSKQQIQYLNNHYKWATKDVPAFKNEKYITSKNDCISKVDFQFIGTNFNRIFEPYNSSWETISKSLLSNERFGRFINNKGVYKNEVAELKAETKDRKALLIAIYNYMSDYLSSNGIRGLRLGNSIKETNRLKSGNIAQVNLSLIAALRVAGFDANPVILSTRDNGRIYVNNAPRINNYNYVIAHVTEEGKEYLLDISNENYPFNTLPPHCLNGIGRLLKKEGGKWVSLKSPKSVKMIISNLTLDESGSIQGTVRTSEKGYSAIISRTTKKKSDDDKKFTTSHLKIKKETDFDIDSISSTNLDTKSKPFKVKYNQLKINEFADVIGNRIYLGIPLDNLFNKNPFKNPERKFPVDFTYQFANTNIISLTIPENYQVEEIPKGISLLLPNNGGKYFLTIKTNGDKIQINTKLDIRKSEFSANEYKDLRTFFSMIVGKKQEQITLIRKN